MKHVLRQVIKHQAVKKNDVNNLPAQNQWNNTFKK